MDDVKIINNSRGPAARGEQQHEARLDLTLQWALFKVFLLMQSKGRQSSGQSPQVFMSVQSLFNSSRLLAAPSLVQVADTLFPAK